MKAISESVAHPSEKGIKPGQLQMSVIDQAAENRPLKEPTFTQSLLLCLIMGSQSFFMCCTDTQKESRFSCRKRKWATVLSGIKSFLFTTSATEYNRKNQ